MKKMLTGSMALLALAAAPVRAHHSFAAFDMEKTAELRGTVLRYEWTNPHVWIWVMPEAGGTEVGIEGHAVFNMVRTGWSRESLKVGDKIVVQMHPRKNGELGGSLVSVALPDGTPVPANAPPR